MKTDTPQDSAIEIIDIIDDGADPFGDRAQHTVHDSGGPRWVGPTAAAALVALIGYGIATSASTSSVPKVAEAPSTTVVSTTIQPATPTTEPRPVVPYYSADPPRGYQVQYAEANITEEQRFYPGNYQLWATSGATATSGSWFSIQSLQTGPQQIYAVDAFRVPTTDQTMVISRMPSGQSTIRFSIDNRMSVTITAFGWGDDDLVRLAQSVKLNKPSLAGDKVVPSDPTLIDNFQLLTALEPFRVVFGQPAEQVYYSSVGSDPSLGFSIGVVHLDPRKGDEDMAARRVALRFLLDHPTTFDIDGRSALAGAIVGQPGQAMATWIAGDHMVHVVGNMSIQEMIMLARTVHQVSPEEWEGMRFQATRNNNQLNVDYTQSESRAVSFGTDADGGQWTINVSMSTFGGDRQSVDWQWLPGSGFGSVATDTARITTVVDGNRTYVLADLPRSVAATAQLEVVRTGFEPAPVPFNDIDPALDRTFAAYAFTEPTTYTAQIIAADGAVLATWPSA